MTVCVEIEPGAYWLKASALNTKPNHDLHEMDQTALTSSNISH